MKLSDFDYKFPKELIAKYPSKKRDDSRLLILNRKDNSIKEERFPAFLNYIKKGDCLVLNDVLVRKRRLFGKKITGGKLEVLLLDEIKPNSCNVLISPSRGIKVGSEIFFDENLKGTVVDNKDSVKKIEFSSDEKKSLEDIFEKIGSVPLPPYIKRPLEKLDEERYQTVYAKSGCACAAPTAGLHFTDEILEKIKSLGAKIAYLTLDVSFGTFSPIKNEDFTRHRMFKEHFNLPEDSAGIINKAKSNGKKIIAVGTTSLKVLEACATKEGKVEAKEGDTDLFIYPPYRFKIVDILLTNFHFPRSTLLLLVSAFAKDELIKAAYKYAIENNFRLFSYGDAMLII